MPFADPHDPAWTPLLEAAWAARERAHAPYSRFRVGAALQAADGRIFAGCNVENAAYPLCTCAERVAVCRAAAEGMLPGELAALVVVNEAQLLTAPCGACRQVIREFALDLPILLSNGPERQLHRLSVLLPAAFGPDDLSKAPRTP